MVAQHIVRIGVMGLVGRFRAVDACQYPRGSRVICRTQRGLEVGSVLCTTNEPTVGDDGALLRRVTQEDAMLLERLDRHRDRAMAACQQLLNQRQLPVVLLDVEHLFDGESLYFYFLGDVTAEVTAATGELAEVYDAQAQIRQFGKTLAEGCGPGCGTEEASGCSIGGCETCAVAEGCKK